MQRLLDKSSCQLLQEPCIILIFDVVGKCKLARLDVQLTALTKTVYAMTDILIQMHQLPCVCRIRAFASMNILSSVLISSPAGKTNKRFICTFYTL